MTYEYKTVGAPEKGKRKRGARSASDKVAVAFEEIIQREAVDGWEYHRTDLLPTYERPSMFGRMREMHRAVMVFRRSLEREEPAMFLGAPVAAPAPAAATAPVAAPAPVAPLRAKPETPPLRTNAARDPKEERLEPVVAPEREPDLQIADIVRGNDRKAD